jgi:hypothetical protein
MQPSTSATPAASKGLLLSIIELGGYPNFVPLYEQNGYRVIGERSVRKAIGQLKKITADVIVAEFNFQSDFRDRTSSLESLLAVIQKTPATKLIVFYERDQAHQLDKLRARFSLFEALPYPIEEGRLAAALLRARGASA